MGGRGTFAVDNPVKYAFEKVDEIHGVKVLEPIDKSDSFKLPVESHSSQSYILLDKHNGIFRQYREFNNMHLITKEIGYHFESGLSEHGESVFHVHDYSKPGIDFRQKARLMRPEEIQKYRKYFVNISDSDIDNYIKLYHRRANK